MLWAFNICSSIYQNPGITPSFVEGNKFYDVWNFIKDFNEIPELSLYRFKTEYVFGIRNILLMFTMLTKFPNREHYYQCS